MIVLGDLNGKVRCMPEDGVMGEFSVVEGVINNNVGRLLDVYR